MHKAGIYILIGMATFAVAACKPKVDPDTADKPVAAQPTPAVATAPEAPKAVPKSATRERIAEIVASGRTGFWSDITSVCPGQHPRAILTWNVKDAGAQRVVVYAVNNKGAERNFGNGGPVGEKQTGPWLRPGLTFRLRDRDTKKELSNLVIEARPAKECRKPVPART